MLKSKPGVVQSRCAVEPRERRTRSRVREEDGGVLLRRRREERRAPR